MDVSDLCDCTSNCHSNQCASNLISVITRGSTRQIKTYFKRCNNAAHVSDVYGRTALHMASSCGKWEIVDWLMKEMHADHKSKDKESGWTALHRSLFYGQVKTAVNLIYHGASIHKHDNEDLTPLELLMKDRPVYVEYDPRNPTQAYTWGTNANFTLGHGNQQSRGQPELLEELAKSGISIKQVSMCKFHTVLLSHQGTVYTCGHGQGGRLGLGNEETSLVPTRVEGLAETVCVQVDTARDHTVFLMENGTIYSCGQNDYHQLGHSSLGATCLTPKPIYNKAWKNKPMAGVVVGRFHSVAYTNQALYTFGLNAGQLGHSKGEKYLISPRQVTALQHKNVALCQVAASDAATVVATKAGDIYVLNEYQCRKVASKQINLTKMVVNGGTLDAELDHNALQKRGGEELVIVTLQKSGRIHSWRETDRVLKTCQWTRKRQVFISDVAIHRQGVLLATEDGEGYMGYFTKNKETSSRKKESTSQSPPPPVVASSPPHVSEDAFIFAGPLEKEEYELMHLERLPSIFRATGVACDRQGTNFAILQSDPRTSLTDIPLVSESRMEKHLANLMSEADTTDVIHDVVIKIGNRTVAAHKYILSHQSEYFRKLFAPKQPATQEDNSDISSSQMDNEGAVIVDITDKAEYDIFMMMLRYLYTDTCCIFKRGFKYKPSSMNYTLKEENSEKSLHTGLDSLTITDLNRNQSAFSAYKERQEKGARNDGKGQGGKKKKKTIEKGEREDAMLPVTLLIAFAKKFGVSALTKRLDQVKYKDSELQNFRPSSKKLRFERKRVPHLCDVVLQSGDGQLFPCHKCILVARLEYFQSMLGAGWIETSTSDPLKLPIAGSILHLIIEFIYTDKASSIHECQDIEFLCNALTTADQLLMTRLKEMCEGALADLITLKNVAEVLQFASIYQATQLCCTCQQFIALNLGCLLEARALEILDKDVLQELTVAYRDALPVMCYRMVTPYTGGPDISYIDSEEASDDESSLLADNQGKDLQQKDNLASSNLDQIIRKARVRRKGRRRTSSSGKRNSVSISESAEETTSLVMETKEALKKNESTKKDIEFSEFKDEAKDLSVMEKDNADDMPLAIEIAKFAGGDSQMTEHVKTLNGELAQEVANPSGTWLKKGQPHPLDSRTPLRTLPKTVTQQACFTTVSQPPDESSRATSPKSWGWQSTVACTPDPTPSDLRNIMQAQATTTAVPKNQTYMKTQVSVGKKSPAAIGKKSQKQRKKELSVQFSTADVAGDGDGQQTEERLPSCPWASVAQPSASATSLKQLQEEEIKQHVVSSRQAPVKRSQSISVPKAQAHISYGHGVRLPPTRSTSESDILATKSGATSPDSSSENLNPWQQGHSVAQSPWQQCHTVAHSPPTNLSVSFTDILKSEAEHRENLNKSLKKSFSLIQVEERAVEELKTMYKVSDCLDEYVTIERVGVVVATPTWEKEKKVIV